MALSTISSTIVLVICLFFYLYVIGSFFNITIYPLLNRVTSHVAFQEYVISENLDNIVVIVTTISWFLLSIKNRAIRYSLPAAYGVSTMIFAIIIRHSIIFDILVMLSLPLIIGLALYHYKQRRKERILNSSVKLALRYISLVIMAINIITIAVSILALLNAPDFESIAQESYSNQLYLLLSSFATIYIFLLIFCLPVKLLFGQTLKILKLDIVEDDISQTQANNPEQSPPRRQTKIGLLLFAMILPVILVLIPQHPSINVDNQDIGVDTHYYVTWVGELARSKSAFDFAYQAFVIQGQDGDRPLSLLFLFLIYHFVGGDLSDVIEYSPIILGPGIVLAFYFLTLELVRNEKIALISALLSAVSLHTLAGIYAGFYANWLALIVGYAGIAFLFRYLRSGRVAELIIFSVLLIGVLFFHLYTWTILAAVAGVFLLTLLVIKDKMKPSNTINQFTRRRIIWLLIFALVPSVVVDISKVLLTGSSGGLEQDIEIAQRDLGIDQFNLRWEILNITMHHTFGGVFGSFIILILGLFWALKSNMREPATIFLMIFLSTGVIPLFFGSWVIQARVLYDIPFEIPAAIAIYYISRKADSLLVPLAGCAWLVAVSIFTVMNFNLISEPGVQQ